MAMADYLRFWNTVIGWTFKHAFARLYFIKIDMFLKKKDNAAP